MHRAKIALVSLFALAGCSTTPATTQPVTAGLCNAGPGQAFVGRIADAATGQEIVAATGSRILRWAAPDSMMTMEFSPERVTVHYGTDMRIGQVICG